MTQERRRRLAAVWFADIVGYSDLSARDEDLALQVMRELRDLARIQCDALGGRIAKLSDNGILATFDSADGGVRAAANVRDGFLNSPQVGRAGVSLRVGLHLGDVVEAMDGEVYGDAVNAASRIEGVAQSGQVVLSEVAYRLLTPHSGIEVEDLGTHDLKDLGPTRLYSATSSGAREVEDLHTLLQDALAPLQLLGEEGRGGMGAIYLARDPGLRRTLAVKVLKTELAADKGARARFLREAQVIAGLSHPNVIGVYSVGELSDGTPYFVMDYVEGGSLDARLQAGEPLSVAEARSVLGEVASALAAAHERGVVHRDIKPSNVLYDAESGRCLVSDWGIAALDPAASLSPDTRLTQTGAIIGSPKFMSPEQLAGDEVGPESDMYALGLLGFELLTGAGPFHEETPRGVMIAHLREEPPALSSIRADVDPELDLLVAQCLAKEPAARPTAERVASRLAPGADSRLEWPPPGLDGLLGRGRRAGAAGVFGLLMLQIPLAAVLLGLPLPGIHYDTPGIGPNPYVLLVGVMGVGALLVFYSVWHLVRAGIVWNQGLALGFGWSTLAEVASDIRADTGALITGAREYIALSSSKRRRLRQLRLFASFAPFVGIALLLAAALAGPRLLPSVGGSIPLFVLLFLPPILLVVTGALTELVEIRWVGGLRRDLNRRRAPSGSLRRLVAPWYASLEDSTDGSFLGTDPKGWTSAGWVGLAVTVIAVVSGVYLTLPITVMTLVGPSRASEVLPRFSSAQERFRGVEAVRHIRLEPDPTLDARDAAVLLDSLWRTRWDEVGDSVWVNRPTAATIAGSGLVIGGPLGSCREGRTECSRDVLMPDSAIILAARGLSREEAQYLAAYRRDPRASAWSTLARARAVDEWLVVELNQGAPLFGPGVSYGEVPIHQLSHLRETAYLRLAYAAWLLNGGDLDGAEHTLREVGSVGMLLTDEGSTIIGALVGAVLVGMAVDQLRLLYTLTGEREKVAALQPSSGDGGEFQIAGGNIPDVAIALRDPSIMRQLKWELMPAFIYREICTSPQAMWSGLAPSTRQFLDDVLRPELVRYPLEGDLFDLVTDLEAAVGDDTPNFQADLRGQLLALAWRSARLTGNGRLAACLSWSR